MKMLFSASWLAVVLCSLPASLVAAEKSSPGVRPSGVEIPGGGAPDPSPTLDRTLRLPEATLGRRVVLPEDLKKLLQEFQRAREAFDSQREELLRQTRGATEADRIKFREQFQEIRRQLLEQQRQIREEVRRRMEELKQELPQRQELIEAAREKTRDRRGRDGE